LKEAGLIRTLAAFVLALTLAACGQGRGVTIEDAEFRPPLGSTGIGVGYFTIRSDKADRILAITSPEAASIEIHASVTEGGNVSMQKLDGVDLPAGKTVKFESGGMHLMVFSPRVSGDALTFPITIELQSGATPTARFRVITGSAEHHG
jgi:copper(I)-binding protein